MSTRTSCQRLAIRALAVLGAVLHFAQVGHFLWHDHARDADGGWVHRHVAAAAHDGCCAHADHERPAPGDENLSEGRDGDEPRHARPGHPPHACGWLPPALEPCFATADVDPLVRPVTATIARRPIVAPRTVDCLVFAPKHGPPAA